MQDVIQMVTNMKMTLISVFQSTARARKAGRGGKLTPEVVTLSYKWSPEDEDLKKPRGRFFVGYTSPEGLVALNMARTKSADGGLPGVVIDVVPW